MPKTSNHHQDAQNFFFENLFRAEKLMLVVSARALLLLWLRAPFLDHMDGI
jgi:hypothetical protein